MKKIIVLLLVAVMTLGLLACGKTQTDKNNKDNNKVNTTKDTTKLDWSKGAAASDGKITLRFATWRGADEELFEKLIAKFEKQYDWIDVDLEINSNESSYYSNMTADLLSNTAPDVFNVHPAYFNKYVQEGYIAPQEDFAYWEKYDENAKAATTYNGKNYGFLANYNYFGFLYNKDIFSKEGIAVPTTPDELIVAVNKLKKAGYGGVMVAGKTWGVAYGNAIMMNVLGSDKFSELKHKIDNGSITDITEFPGVEEGLKTMQAYTDNDIYYKAYAGTDQTAGMSLFAQEKTAIIYGGTYMFGEKDVHFPGINAGFFPIPTYANTGISFAEGGEDFVINVNSDKLGAAKLFVEFIATSENLDEFNRKSMKLSTITDCTWKFDDIQTYVKDYGMAKEEFYNNEEYWSSGLSNIFTTIIYEGEDWQALNKVYRSKLEEFDLAAK